VNTTLGKNLSILQNQRSVKTGENLFDMVRHKDEVRGIRRDSQPLKKLKESFASDRIQSGTGLIEN
jgi:hypothetical protein